MYQPPAWIRERPIAHRGLHDAAPGITDAPENSLAAIDAAIARGYGIELDLRLLADGHVAVFHDAELERMTGARGRVAALRREQLAELRLPGGHEIPLLRDVLERVDGRAPLLLELKSERAAEVGPLERAVFTRLERYAGPFALQSFNPVSLAFFRARTPTWPRGQLSYDFRDDRTIPGWKQFILRRLLLNVVSRPHFISYEVNSLPFWATTLTSALGLPLLAWTVDSPKELARARARADNIIFEGLLP